MNTCVNKGATQVVRGFAHPMQGFGIACCLAQFEADEGSSIIAGSCDTAKLLRANESEMRVTDTCCFVQFEADAGSSIRADQCVMNVKLLGGHEFGMRVADCCNFV